MADASPAERAIAQAFEAAPAPTAEQQRAWEAFAAAGLPHRRVEGWRWSDVRGARVSLLDGDASAPSTEFAPSGVIAVDLSQATETRAEIAPGLSVMRIAAAPVAAWALDHPLGALVMALQPGAVMVEITGAVSQPVLLQNAPVHAGQARVAVVARENAHATVVEVGDPRAANTLVDIGLQSGAVLSRVVLEQGAGARLTGVHAAHGARYHQTALSFGATLARLETHVQVQGPGADITLNGVSLLAGDAHADHTTVVTHDAPGAVTRETFRSVVTDAGRGVFQGKIKVAREAQDTDARMNHAALLLSDKATVNAKPELEIYADNVQCAHGATAGALDADALHYMRSRGLPEARAKALLVEAFVGEVLDGVAHEETRERLRAIARDWMEARL